METTFTGSTTLGLKLPTDPRWVNIAEKNIHEILIDHAYCEQKAASSGISLITLYPEKTKLVEVITQIVAEEWEHFSRVLQELKLRGLELGPQRKDEYVAQLLQHEQKGGNKDLRMLDRLLISALIEARSCERFKILSEEITDKPLATFYRELMISEAGHYKVYLELAREYLPEKTVTNRWAQFLKIEAEIISGLDVRPDRMH